jgi:hypothetical protein
VFVHKNQTETSYYNFTKYLPAENIYHYNFSFIIQRHRRCIDSTIDLLKGEKTSIIKDIKVLSNGHVVMIDGNNNRILSSEIGGIKQKEFPLPGKPFCLAISPDDTAAVSLYDKGKVIMVDIFSRQIFREIVITCFGLVCDCIPTSYTNPSSSIVVPRGCSILNVEKVVTSLRRIL